MTLLYIRFVERPHQGIDMFGLGPEIGDTRAITGAWPILAGEIQGPPARHDQARAICST